MTRSRSSSKVSRTRRGAPACQSVRQEIPQRRDRRWPSVLAPTDADNSADAGAAPPVALAPISSVSPSAWHETPETNGGTSR